MRIKRALILSLCFAWALPVCVHAQSLFWQVSSSNSMLYLLGSVHMGTADMFPLPDNMEQAFERSEVLAVEVNMDLAGGYTTGKLLVDKGLYPGTETVYDHLQKDTAEKLRHYLQQNHLNNGFYTKLKPAMLMMLVTSMEAARSGLSEDYGVDIHFMRKAFASGKPVVELESAAFQINMLFGLPEDGMVKLMLSETTEMRTELLTLISLWKAGDADQFHEFFYERSIKRFPELKPLVYEMLDKRNIGMAEKIKGYLKSGKTHFVVAGAGHMTGKQGIVQMLRDAGYTIKQL